MDLFCHWIPPGLEDKFAAIANAPLHMFQRAKAIPVMAKLEKRLALMDAFPGYQQIPSLVSPPLEMMGDPKLTPELAGCANDLMAETAARYPDYFPGFVASLPLNNPDASVREAERAVQSLGAKGVQIFTNVNGKPLDLPEFMPLFACMAKLDCPIWLHPTRGIDFPDYASEKTSQHEIWWSLGWPYETSAAILRLVFAGVLERWPGLKIITHHMGGMIPMMEGRLSAGMEVYGSRTPEHLKHTANARLKDRPIDAVRRFYADTASFGSKAAIASGIHFFGVSKVVFATDMPFDPDRGPRFIRETLKLIHELDLTDNEVEQILYGNARKLLKLEERQ